MKLWTFKDVWTGHTKRRAKYKILLKIGCICVLIFAGRLKGPWNQKDHFHGFRVQQFSTESSYETQIISSKFYKNILCDAKKGQMHSIFSNTRFFLNVFINTLTLSKMKTHRSPRPTRWARRCRRTSCRGSAAAGARSRGCGCAGSPCSSGSRWWCRCSGRTDIPWRKRQLVNWFFLTKVYLHTTG